MAYQLPNRFGERAAASALVQCSLAFSTDGLNLLPMVEKTSERYASTLASARFWAEREGERASTPPLGSARVLARSPLLVEGSLG